MSSVLQCLDNDYKIEQYHLISMYLIEVIQGIIHLAYPLNQIQLQFSEEKIIISVRNVTV